MKCEKLIRVSMRLIRKKFFLKNISLKRLRN